MALEKPKVEKPHRKFASNTVYKPCSFCIVHNERSTVLEYSTQILNQLQVFRLILPNIQHGKMLKFYKTKAKYE